jgi:hypothetical protein
MPLVFYQLLDRPDEGKVKLVRESEVEQHGLVRGLLQLFEIEAVTERGDFARELLRPDRDRSPFESVPCERENVALFLAKTREEQRLVATEQGLYLVGL